MKSLQKICYSFVAATFLVLLSQSLFAQGHQIEFSSEERLEDRTIVVSWRVLSRDEGPIPLSSFKLERTNHSNGQTADVSRDIEKISDYEFIYKDTDLYKQPENETASQVEVSYTLYVDGEEYDQIRSSYTTNAVRRTWGDIKSMFQ
ncbi:hypothetical protein [Natronogracilivirga saccharolytica]|uniref:Uncharacterized protein n=1 Tax=Natronogracilivirga saccharolytica TaxID=2812953 RepID=A0A8J7S6V0_9BACT|nr:hypothetical protein [Natronogracilivirga saccharolytica]MBP3191333.1 hypothetical protein [Natronogracilivirga saccharolytica]